MMNANDVLIDLLEDNQRRLHRFLASIPDELVYWYPEPGSNNMAVTIWHMTRIFDVFLNQQALGFDAEKECWFSNGWAVQTGYDPRGCGQNGWGILTGYSQEEVAAMPRMTREQVLGYLDDVYDTVRQYLLDTSIEILMSPAAGFEGKYSQYQCIQMALMDNVRHLGEIFSIKSHWDRMEGSVQE